MTTNTIQHRTFSPLDEGFRWTEDGFTFDHKLAHTEAKRQRDATAVNLRAEGYKVKRSSLSDQLVSRGGIGTNHPHIELIVTVYCLDWWKGWII